MIKLIIFDFDDTIIDNRLSDYQGFVRPSKKLKISNPSINSIYQFRKQGLLAKDIVLKINEKNEKRISIQKFLKIRREFINGIKVIEYFRLKQNMRSLLRFLKREQIRCVICSVRNNRKIIKKFCEQEKILDYFEKIYLQDNLDMNITINNLQKRIFIKTRLIKKIKKEQKIKDNEILFVGNAIEDIESATKTKINFIFFKNKYIPKSPKINLKNIQTVSNMKNIKRKIKKIN